VPSKEFGLDHHLAGLSPDERAIWDRYLELIDSAGPSELVVTKSRIAFRTAHRIFTGGFFKSRRFELFFDLPEPVPETERDHRFRAVWQQADRLWVHRLKIEKPAELDRKLRTWLAKSCASYSKPAAER
jgi:Domain of unknown function (DUF5655)